MRTLIAGVGLALLAACNAADDPTLPSTEELTLLAGGEDEMALDAAWLDDGAEPAAMIDGAVGLRWRLPKPVYKLLDAWGALIDETCTTETEWVDKDEDGVPADTTVVFDCVEKLGTTGNVVTITGKITVRDNDDAVPGGGFDVAFQRFAVKTARLDGSADGRTLDGSSRLLVLGTPPNPWKGIHLVKDFRMELERTLVTGLRIEAVQTSYLTGLYAPDRMITSRDPLARGALTFEGKGEVEQYGRTWTRSFATDPSLHWSRACAEAKPSAPGFDGGAVLFRDDSGRVLRIQFRGCGKWVETYRSTG
jgi:hypothetical protein